MTKKMVLVPTYPEAEEITIYKASDGTTHEDKNDAMVACLRHDLYRWIDTYTVKSYDPDDGDTVTVERIVNALIQYGEDLQLILNANRNI